MLMEMLKVGQPCLYMNSRTQYNHVIFGVGYCKGASLVQYFCQLVGCRFVCWSVENIQEVLNLHFSIPPHHVEHHYLEHSPYFNFFLA